MNRFLVRASLFGVLALSAGACSSSSSGAATTTLAIATTTTIGATTTAPPATVQAAPSTTTKVAPTTVAPTTLKPAKPIVEYLAVAGPDLPGTTKAINADDTHPDGVYYGTIGVGGDPAPAAGSVVFELVQLFTGADCIAHFGSTDEEACANDYGVEVDPTSFVVVPLASQYITVVDGLTQTSHQVSGAELYRLVQGQAPAVGAPSGFEYSGFGFFVTYKGGTVTRLEQWWTP